MSLFEFIPSLLSGLGVTLTLTGGGALVAVVLAWLAGLARLSHFGPLRLAAATYVETFRGTSALVQLYWFFYALPLFGIELSATATGIIVLGLNIGAYGAEVVRGAVLSIDRGQSEAAAALNLSNLKRLWIVIAPQALLRMLPPAGNLLIELLKSTALVSLITLNDLTFRGMLLRAETLRTVEVFGLLLIIYFCVAQVLTLGLHAAERRLSKAWHLEGAR
ncbi:MAG: ectoine/hydroxyectoine ABC transporter permease subunit EhuC [Candidatus Hydrogenedentes bacterium]|nr:ectoine/hydroxyectoine ABC transporter permease subunit EhuC [Candidatus Hydrogenedentota bacterium]